jgi:hypothetical protein
MTKNLTINHIDIHTLDVPLAVAVIHSKNDPSRFSHRSGTIPERTAREIRLLS